MKKSYVMIHVIKHNIDPNSNLNYRRKNGPLQGTLEAEALSTPGKFKLDQRRYITRHHCRCDDATHAKSRPSVYPLTLSL